MAEGLGDRSGETAQPGENISARYEVDRVLDGLEFVFSLPDPEALAEAVMAAREAVESGIYAGHLAYGLAGSLEGVRAEAKLCGVAEGLAPFVRPIEQQDVGIRERERVLAKRFREEGANRWRGSLAALGIREIAPAKGKWTTVGPATES